MPFRVSGKNIDIGQALRARVNARSAEDVRDPVVVPFRS